MLDLKRSSAILLLALIGSAGVAGCGGGGGDEEEPAPAPVETPEQTVLTKNELISQGDDYCAEVNAAVGTISSSTTADDSLKESQIASIYEGLAEDLDALGAPSEGDAPTDVIEAAQALADSDSTTSEAALATFQSAADEYGFTECGEAPAAPSSSTGEAPSESPDTGGGTYVEPAPSAPVEPAPAPAPAPVPPPSNGGGGGVAPTPPADTGGGSGSGGSSSGGISPG